MDYKSKQQIAIEDTNFYCNQLIVKDIDEHLQPFEATPYRPENELHDRKDTLINSSHLVYGLNWPTLKRIVAALILSLFISIFLGFLTASMGSCEKASRKLKPWCELCQAALNIIPSSTSTDRFLTLR